MSYASVGPISDPFGTATDHEISRVLDYQVPTIDSKSRREISQSESQGTYLSRQRSFLAEPSVQDPMFGLEDLWNTDPDPPDSPMEDDPGVKSWHELKRGGEDKRLLDEMEDLIEECKSSGRIGLRRSSVLQIVQKLFDDITWRRKFKALGLMSTFIQNVKDAKDDPVLFMRRGLILGLVDDVFVGGGDGAEAGATLDDGDCFGDVFEGIGGEEGSRWACVGAVVGRFEDSKGGVY